MRARRVMAAGLRRRGWGTGAASVLIVGFVWAMALAGLLPAGRPAPAEAAVAYASAADLVPTAAELPPGFQPVAEQEVGGDLEPAIAVRRTFADAAGRVVVVDVALGVSAMDAQDRVDARVNQLVQYHGWRFGTSKRFGEQGYQGSVVDGTGRAAEAVVFRINAVSAEVRLEAARSDLDPAVLDAAARAVEGRILAQPDLAAIQPSFGTPTPAPLPGKEPAGPPPGAVVGVVGVAAPPGAAVTGASSGSPVQGDTVVLLTVTGLDRPWATAGAFPTAPAGTSYLTVNVQIEVRGPTPVEVALTDFWVTTIDGRAWAPVLRRQPPLRLGQANASAPASGWLTFLLPAEQQALELTWRLRTTQPLDAQGGADQIMVVPLTVGAVASASVGTTASPAGVPVVPVPGPGMTVVP